LLNHSEEAPWEAGPARGPVGIPLDVGETVGIVGEAPGSDGVEGAPPHVGPASDLRSANEPPRPPLGCGEPREAGL